MNAYTTGKRIDLTQFGGGWAKLMSQRRAHYMERCWIELRALCDVTLTPRIVEARVEAAFEPGDFPRCAACARIEKLQAQQTLAGLHTFGGLQ